MTSRARDRDCIELQVSEPTHDGDRGLARLPATTFSTHGESGPLGLHEAGPGQRQPPGFSDGQGFHGRTDPMTVSVLRIVANSSCRFASEIAWTSSAL